MNVSLRVGSMPLDEASSRDDRVNEVTTTDAEQVERGKEHGLDWCVAHHDDLTSELNSSFPNQSQPGKAAGDVVPDSTSQCGDADSRLKQPTSDPNATTITFPQRDVPPTRNVVRHFGDYELIREIARGGMGVVFKARQISLNRIVAVKMILGGQLADPEDVRRFHTEAEAAAQLDHPGIVPIYEVGEHEGQHFFSMGFVEGENLSKRVSEGPLEPRAAAEIVKTVAEAVQHAHEKGVIHRDLKPANILLDRDGNPRVTDFGLAKLTVSVSDLTGTGQILGTPSYMPPEQAAAHAGEVGRASDVYSLGAILYCLLTGRPPFQAASLAETLLQVQTREPPPLRRLNPEIPRNLETICLKCLRKETSRRYSSSAQLATDLGNWLENKPIAARPVSPNERIWLWCKRRPTVAAMLFMLVTLSIVGTLGAVEWQNSVRAAGLVDELTNADIARVPDIVSKLGDYHQHVHRLLNVRYEMAAPGSPEKLRISLALLPVDNRQMSYLRDQLLSVRPSEFPIVRDSLIACLPALSESLWQVACDTTRATQHRFQAACALAAYTPNDERWRQISGFVASRLVTFDASEFVAWRTALQRARNQFLEPLAAIYRSEAEREHARTYAVETLAEYTADDPDMLFDLLADADQFQFSRFYNKLPAHRERFVELGKNELARQPSLDASEREREALARRQANVAVALLRIGSAQHVWPLLKHSPDPRARSYFIHWLGPRGGDPQTIIRRLDEEDDVTIRRALLLALGEFSEEQLPPTERARLIKYLLTIFQSDPDPGLHSSAEWLLRRWGQAEQLTAIVQNLRNNDPRFHLRPPADNQRWYVNRQGQTFVILEADTFEMGSPESDPDRIDDKIEIRHARRIGRTIAIDSKEVTRKEFQRFLDDEDNRELRDSKLLLGNNQFSLTGDSPQNAADWYDSAHYCNWLSKTEGLPKEQWCYEPNRHGKYAEGMRAAAAADFLDRTGYRLPTEAEWEFACRAGAVTSRYFGANASLLPRYAWCFENSSRNHAHPTGLLKPNDFGLFDMLGNVQEWCHESFRLYRVTPENRLLSDNADMNDVEENYGRSLRGASFDARLSFVRSANRATNRPGIGNYTVGLRPARTYR